MKLSIALPTSKMANGKELFIRCLNSLWRQSFQDFEIVVCDNSDDSEIYEVCCYYSTGIKYYLNPIKGMAQNTNEAIRKSEGELIKILYMDDYLAHKDSLWKIVSHFEGEWLVTGCLHDDGLEVFNPHVPMYTGLMREGKNTIGSPSVLTIKNKSPLLFDESMTWMLDCDYYLRAYEKLGKPTVLKDMNVVIGLHPGQATHTMGEERKLKEQEYMLNKYANA